MERLFTQTYCKRTIALQTLVTPYRAILRYYRCDTPYRAILFQGGLHSPKKVRYPPHWYLVSHRPISAIPHFAAYRAITVRYPIKTSTKYFCDTIATSIARYEKYRCWASKCIGSINCGGEVPVSRGHQGGLLKLQKPP